MLNRAIKMFTDLYKIIKYIMLSQLEKEGLIKLETINKNSKIPVLNYDKI
jgi:hypothetical protein